MFRFALSLPFREGILHSFVPHVPSLSFRQLLIPGAASPTWPLCSVCRQRGSLLNSQWDIESPKSTPLAHAPLAQF